MVSRAILSNFFEEQWTQNHPQYLSGLSRALLPTTFLKIAVYCRETSHEGPFKTSRVVIKRRKLGISPGYSKHGPWLYFQRKIQCRRKACTRHTTAAFVTICSQILLVSLMRYDISPVSWLVRVVPFDRAPPGGVLPNMGYIGMCGPKG